ncbi:hypothetical protein Vadar_031268 [Vaccinium darrowii]|uniref:Uncharacterized protein n=1 Tax=Vaccinium darrowii TaxID=229202 RepID=A0ACB7YQS4_9ERIC|nr:hypothetical protein Vadar_031268 [Vaccinium darrowii]
MRSPRPDNTPKKPRSIRALEQPMHQPLEIHPPLHEPPASSPQLAAATTRPSHRHHQQKLQPIVYCKRRWERRRNMEEEGGEIIAPSGLELESIMDWEDFHSRRKVFNGIVEALKDPEVNMIGVYGARGVGIPITDHNKRCKVVITSQNRDVWKKMDVKDFKIEFLSEEEAWTLFKKVGDVDLNDQPLCDIAWAICKDCEGLPLAVKAFAAALRGKDMNVWQDALNKLKKSMLWDIEGIDTKVYGSLRRDYDWLDSEDAKACFLLCCLFSEDAEIPIDGLVRYYMAGWTFDQKPDTFKRALYQVRTLVDTLKSQGLLLDGNSEDTVKMHAVMRHVSTSIANNDESFFVDLHVKQWPAKATYEHCSLISLRPDDMLKFPNELVCPTLHILRLDCTGNKFHVQVPDKFFSGTENLTILDLKSVTILPALLAKLAKLKMLCLNGCNLGDIAILKDLKDHLDILSLQGSNIEVLPLEVGELTRLRLLDMADCKELRMIPKGVVSNLVSLEVLYMPWSFRQWEGTTQRKISRVSLDELMSLTRLTTLHFHIPDTALFPRNFTFGNLDRFRISIGGEGLIGNWGQGDRALVLENIHIATALEYFVGKGKSTLQRNGLYISTSFIHLTNLSVRDCRLKYLFSPSCARRLDQLQYLTVESCTVTEGVIGIEGEKDEDMVIIFRQLKYLSLDGLPNLISFYPREKKTAKNSGSSSAHSQMVLFNDKVIFSVLERLTISKVGNIIEIFDKQSIAVIKEHESFCRLMYVDVKECDNLMHVFPSKICPMLMNPHELDVRNCGSMEGIIEFEGELDKDGLENEVCLSKLRRMKLRSLPKFISICTRLGKAGTTEGNSTIYAQPFFAEEVTFPRLENLELEGCGSLTYIFQPSMARDLVNLQELIINDCSKMEAVLDGEEEIDRQGRKSSDKTLLPYLIKLELRHLPKLRRFCHSSNPLELPLLSQMVIWDCPRMDSFSLGYMSSSANAQMVLFVNDKVAVPRLGILELEGCKNLRYIFQPSMARVVRLQELIINDCSKMEAVIDGQQEIEDGQGTKSTDKTLLPHLSKLELRHLPELRRFCHFRYPVELPLLSQMVIEVCPRMNSFSSGSVSTPNLFARFVSYDFVGDDTTVTEEE